MERGNHVVSLPSQKLITIQEFHHLREQSEQVMEYIDGVVFMAPSPSTAHQRISGRLHAQLFNLLEGKECEVFHAPFDVELKKEGVEGTKIVVPDLSVICDKSGLNDQRYVGVPAIIIEIISPSNQSHDLVTKLNLYMEFGVKEYWIVNPLLNTVQIYTLNEKGQYHQTDVVRETGIVQSKELPGFEVDIVKLFS